MLCPPNKRTRSPRWGRRLLGILVDAAHQAGMDGTRAQEYALELMTSGLAGLALTRPRVLPQLAVRYHACVYDLGIVAET